MTAGWPVPSPTALSDRAFPNPIRAVTSPPAKEDLPLTTPAARLTDALADRYRLERELGQGGMATVYLAEDLKHGRKVAIKVLHPELSAVIGGDRFLAEIKVTANLQHPHILGLIDSGEADGLLYYVMPYVVGRIAPQPPGRATSSSPSTTRSASRGKSPAPSTTPTARASSTATSSPRTSCCRMARRSSPTSASRWPCSRPAAAA